MINRRLDQNLHFVFIRLKKNPKKKIKRKIFKQENRCKVNVRFVVHLDILWFLMFLFIFILFTFSTSRHLYIRVESGIKYKYNLTYWRRNSILFMFFLFPLHVMPFILFYYYIPIPPSHIELAWSYMMVVIHALQWRINSNSLSVLPFGL